MKLVLLVMLNLMSLTAHAWEAIESWSQFYQQELITNCENEDLFCQKLCNQPSQCILTSNNCKDCVGTGILISYFYQEVGRWFINSQDKVSEEELIDFIQQKNFILLTDRSPYNIFSPINDAQTERAFHSLCKEGPGSYPVILGELNHQQELQSIKYVICHDEDGGSPFRMNSRPDLEITLKRVFMFDRVESKKMPQLLRPSFSLPSAGVNFIFSTI
jgi:hypothetical protein